MVEPCWIPEKTAGICVEDLTEQGRALLNPVDWESKSQFLPLISFYLVIHVTWSGRRAGVIKLNKNQIMKDLVCYNKQPE